MNKLLVLLVFLLNTQKAYFQTTEHKKAIDSLMKLVDQSKEDKEKISLYHQICKKYYPEEPSKMMYFNKKIYELSKKTNYKIGYGFYYLNLTDIDYLNSDFEQAIVHGEKAYEILSKTKDVKNHLNAASYLAYAYLDNSNYDKARKILLENLSLAHKYNDPKILGRLYLFLGETYEDETASVEELKNYKKALYYYNKTNDVVGKVSLYQRIAYIYKNIYLHEEALKYLNLALDQKPDDYNYNILQFEKARVYNKMGRYKEANSLALKNEKALSKNQQNSSDVYWINKLCLAISNFGLKKYSTAIKNCNAILAYGVDDDTKMSTLNIIGHSYLKLNNLEKSKYYIDESLTLVNKVNDFGKEDVYKIKSELEAALGNYKIALDYSNKYNLLTTDRNSKINQNRIQHLQVDFEVAEKENEIKKLEIKELQYTLNIEKQKKYLIISSFLILMALISIIVFFRITKSIKKRNRIIENSNLALSKSQLLLQKSLHEKEILLKEIHHRVKNNLQLVMSLLNIQARESDSRDLDDFLEKGQSRIISMALIHENLYQTDQLDNVNFQEYIENLVHNIKNTFNHQNDNILTEIKAVDANFDIQTSIPLGLIINELYCNILKHAFPEQKQGKIVIELNHKDHDNFQLTVSDNGVGLSDNASDKKTLGLELVYLLVDQLCGKITLLKDQGTKYIIDFKEIVN
ncbi:histidine kinase dimerization/phosphoacceptor domain -containing protein [Flavobacterium sp. N2820]|uniref:tetratricopeptide repeat-containing sensor histidine kinase n=1 Tax=Flavobacterium sp. N2820 TaxID=2986834 RepID=UPI0022241085|nr:histidine kinase dimerization/phosphoacceptor domain -containing protein [Flavobacterium sp. N2820]